MTVDFKNSVYSVSLLFRSLRNGSFVASNLWEESIVLLQAQCTEEAVEKAGRIGKSRLLSYTTCDGDELTWEFFKVLEVFQINEEGFFDGMEVFSRHLRTLEVESLLVPFDE